MCTRRRFIAAIFWGSLIITLGWIVSRHIVGLQATETEVEPTVPPVADPAFNITIVQQALDRRRVTMCRLRQCQIVPAAASDNAAAVTDGVSWYHYQDEALRRTMLQSGESEIILAQTPLIKPRGLFISPDNSKVAFWLDNIDQPEKQLTELWAFDEPAGGTKILAEKISQPGVLTQPRWNRSSTHLWFLGESGNPDKGSELLLVSLNPPGISAGFSQLDWNKLGPLTSGGPMDISPSGDMLVYATPKTRKTSYLNFVTRDGKPQATTVRGAVPYVAWLEDNNVLYATQDSSGFAFWQVKNDRHHRLAEIPGSLQSVQTDPQGTYVVIAVSGGRQKVGISTIDLRSGAVAQQMSLPVFGSTTRLVQAQPATDNAAAIAGISTTLDDDEMAKFIELHIGEITGFPAAQQKRLIITDKPNTIYLDFTTGSAQLERVLATVQDAVHPEWSISARFVERGGEWLRTEGGGMNNSQALRLYEWEPQLKQWVLKEDFEP